ncbi:hypothetical protein ABPG77_001726 [Micractinium sp. CCAP 211/92]
MTGTARSCFAGPALYPINRLAAPRFSSSRRIDCCAAAECGPVQGSPQPAPLVQRLAATVQRAAAALIEQRAVASLQLQSGSGGSACQRLGSLALLAAAAAAPLPGSSIIADLRSNYVFCVGFCGWFLAQFLKIFTKAYKTGVWDVRAFFDSGGMPSSHSSLCSSVATAVAMQQGLGSPMFAVCVCFSVIVMYDAMGVRRHAGLQAEVLNIVAESVLEGHPKAEQKLKEVLGHTPRQVAAGSLLGVLVGLFFPVF